mgnify:CR=1 FL=1
MFTRLELFRQAQWMIEIKQHRAGGFEVNDRALIVSDEWQRIFFDDSDAEDRPRRLAHRLSRGADPVLARLSRPIRPVHGVHPGLGVSALADSDGTQWRDLGLYPRCRHGELGSHDDGLHHLAHGISALRHGPGQSDCRRRRA